MMDIVAITNAGLLVLTVGWMLIGIIVTFIAMSHYAINVGHREYQRGVKDGRR
jgi:hypothetical protein